MRFVQPFRSLELQIVLVDLISKSDRLGVLRRCKLPALPWEVDWGWREDAAAPKERQEMPALTPPLVSRQGFPESLPPSAL